jgi:quinol monooxygenase YgiN
VLTAGNDSRQRHGKFFVPIRSIGDPSAEKEKHMIVATIRMTIPPPKRREALQIIRSVAEQCRDNPGCLSCHIYGDLHEKNVLMLEEVWRTEEDLDLRIRSDEYLNLLLVLEMALKQPEIRFDTVSSSTGIETIEKARSQSR